MTKSQLVGLGVRIFGILLLIYSIQYGASFITTALNQPSNAQGVFIAVLVMMAIFFVIAVLFIKFPLAVAGKLLPKDGNELLDWKLTLSEIYAIAYFFLGLFVLVEAIPSVFYWITYGYIYTYTEPPTYKYFSPSDIGSMVFTGVELIIGVWLLLGARGLRGLVNNLRSAGLKTK